MRQVALVVLLVAAAGVHADPNEESCRGSVVDIFGGRLTIPCGFRLQPEFENTIRFLALEVEPGQPYGNIYIGKVSDLPKQEARDADATQMGATIERKTLGSLRVEIVRRTTQQLLRDGSVTYVSALIYDERHYVRAIGTDPRLWQRLLEQCDWCGQ